MNSQEEMVETTVEDYEIFKAECQRWIEIYGLKCWGVYFRHEECEGRYGSCETALTGRVATITFAMKWPGRDYDPEHIKQTAFHEATELLMGPVDALANHRYVSQEEIGSALHAVVRTLENVLYPKYKV
jgi:hypothetical protein